MSYLQLPFFQEIAGARNVLVAGMGGGFDVFCGLPLYFGLKAAGKRVHLANLSFSILGPETLAGRYLAPALVEVTPESRGEPRYFPELYLSRWFEQRGEEVPIYTFPKVGVAPLTEAYEVLADMLELDAILLVDGGTDSLMRGDEPGLGTPVEDITSLAAVYGVEVPTRLMVCLGFGIDHFHGVCHSYFLEAAAELTRAGAFLGAWSLTADMPEVKLYEDATNYVTRQMPNYPSIVSGSILSAVSGQFGNHHATHRTEGSELFINPLMTLYWAFRLEAVAQRLLYSETLYRTQSMDEVSAMIRNYRNWTEHRPWRDLPL